MDPRRDRRDPDDPILPNPQGAAIFRRGRLPWRNRRSLEAFQLRRIVIRCRLVGCIVASNFSTEHISEKMGEWR